MKKILILLATICCCGCGSVETKATSTTETTGTPKIKYYRNDIGGYIYSIEVEGHLYVVFKAPRGGGIIHAEHCPCKMK